jgi:hypothetical protein
MLAVLPRVGVNVVCLCDVQIRLLTASASHVDRPLGALPRVLVAVDTAAVASPPAVCTRCAGAQRHDVLVLQLQNPHSITHYTVMKMLLMGCEISGCHNDEVSSRGCLGSDTA